MTLLKNELSKFRSYNYRWSLAALRPSDIDPSVFLTRDPELMIIKSGGLKDKTIRTAIEEELGINVEYFIDDIEIENLLSANPNTGVGNALTINFTVTEPNSVGLFFQSLWVASKKAGFESPFNKAAFLLINDFIGHDDSGNVVSNFQRRVLVIQFLNITFTVDTGGAVYSVEAMPYNHIGYLDDYQRVKTSMTIHGDTVVDMLNDGPNSLCTALNKQEEQSVENKEKRTANRYKITFPIDNNLPKTTASSLFSYPQSYTEGVDPSFAIRVQQTNPATANYDPNSSDIGNSLMIQDFKEFGIVKFAQDDFIYDATNQLFKRDGLTISATSREFTFSENTKIEKIIEEVILVSLWGKAIAEKQPDSDGWKWWFKIDTKVTVLDPDIHSNGGNPAFEFEYIVIPYKVHKSVVEEPGLPQNYQPLISNCKKAYYYSYTGLNTDIIDFEFKIDNSFFKPLVNFDTSMDAKAVNLAPISDFREPPAVPETVEVIDQNIVKPTVRKPIRINSSMGGAGFSVESRTIAEQFNTLVLNSDVDNIELTLKIWGDPYYLGNDSAGNYRPGAASQYINADGTIDYLRSEIDILLTFKTAVDYSKSNNLMKLDPVNAFNGIYRIIAVKHYFSRGQFTQELTLLRRPNQTLDNVELSNALVTSFYSGSAYNEVQNSVSATGASLRYRPMVRTASGADAKPRISSGFGPADPLQVQTINFEQLESSINDFLDVGNQIKNSLSALRELPRTLSSIPRTLGSVPGALNDIQNTLINLPGAFANFPSTLNSIPGALNSLPTALNSLPTALSDIQGALNTIPTALTNLQGTISSLQGTLNTLPEALSNLPANILQEVGTSVLQQTAPFAEVLVDVFKDNSSIQTGPTQTDIATPASKPIKTSTGTPGDNTGVGIR